jgi:phospholipid/cholesterol/gamma-HCH transport system substrate-binding protein
MAKRQKTAISEMKVGILVTVALILLAAVILQQSWGINWFGNTVKAVTYLPDVGGLKSGAPVWLAGIEIGKVTRVSIVAPEVFSGNIPILQKISETQKKLETPDPANPNRVKIEADLQDDLRSLKLQLSYVQIQLQVHEPYLNRLSRDSEVSIESKGLIGDSFIDISPGTYAMPPRKIGDAYLIEGVRTTGFREIMTGANDVVANFGVLSDQFKNIALKINPDRISSGIGTTIEDLQKTMKQASNTLDHATALVDSIHTGSGTVAKLISDPAAYNNLVASLERLNKIAEQIQSGSGTFSKLIQNPEPFDRLNDALNKIDAVVERIEKGEGTLGRLSKDPALYERINTALEKLATIADQIESGEGTLGKLYKNPALYDNLNQATGEITKLIYDLRQDPKKYLTIRFRLF